MENRILNESKLVLGQLQSYMQKPAPFTPGEPLFWDDPHISKGMLAAHLDSDSDVASRRPTIIDRSVDWIIITLGLEPGSAILDLGCGPGLYASRLARQGMQVTGVDASRRSIDYAVRYAEENGLPITYRYENYLDLEDQSLYDAALLIYGDFCPLNPEQRAQLLANIHRALKPGGYFVLDVTTRLHRQRVGVQNGWYFSEKGFWRPGPHLVLEQGFDYPEQGIYLDQYLVIDADATLSVYRNWFQDYDCETIRKELNAGGFVVESFWSNLLGDPFQSESEWIGIIARRSQNLD